MAAKRGRPKYEPNDNHRLIVKLMKADGATDKQIAEQLRISERMLRTHYRNELRNGAMSVRALALANLVKEANDGNVRAIEKLLDITQAVALAGRESSQDETVLRCTFSGGYTLNTGEYDPVLNKALGEYIRTGENPERMKSFYEEAKAHGFKGQRPARNSKGELI